MGICPFHSAEENRIKSRYPSLERKPRLNSEADKVKLADFTFEKV